jgi:hypothetical protein
VKEIQYLGVTPESSGGWSKQKAKQKVKRSSPWLPLIVFNKNTRYGSEALGKCLQDGV